LRLGEEKKEDTDCWRDHTTGTWSVTIGHIYYNYICGPRT